MNPERAAAEAAILKAEKVALEERQLEHEKAEQNFESNKDGLFEIYKQAIQLEAGIVDDVVEIFERLGVELTEGQDGNFRRHDFTFGIEGVRTSVIINYGFDVTRTVERGWLGFTKKVSRQVPNSEIRQVAFTTFMNESGIVESHEIKNCSELKDLDKWTPETARDHFKTGYSYGSAYGGRHLKDHYRPDEIVKHLTDIRETVAMLQSTLSPEQNGPRQLKLEI